MAHRIVFVNGCFDVLHRGHIELFEFAKSQGEYLIVALDTDARVKKQKGENRPFNSLTDRKKIVSSIEYVDWVESFGTDEELIALVRQASPHVMVVGSDWRGKPIIGSEHAKEIKFFERIDGYSTTQKIQGIINRR